MENQARDLRAPWGSTSTWSIEQDPRTSPCRRRAAPLALVNEMVAAGDSSPRRCCRGGDPPTRPGTDPGSRAMLRRRPGSPVRNRPAERAEERHEGAAGSPGCSLDTSVLIYAVCAPHPAGRPGARDPGRRTSSTPRASPRTRASPRSCTSGSAPDRAAPPRHLYAAPLMSRSPHDIGSPDYSSPPRALAIVAGSIRTPTSSPPPSSPSPSASSAPPWDAYRCSIRTAGRRVYRLRGGSALRAAGLLGRAGCVRLAAAARIENPLRVDPRQRLV